MTPTEKAKELIMKFRQFGLSWDECKECALITVVEIQKESYTDKIKLGRKFNNYEYWQKVQIEITKLQIDMVSSRNIAC